MRKPLCSIRAEGLLLVAYERERLTGSEGEPLACLSQTESRAPQGKGGSPWSSHRAAPPLLPRRPRRGRSAARWPAPGCPLRRAPARHSCRRARRVARCPLPLPVCRVLSEGNSHSTGLAALSACREQGACEPQKRRRKPAASTTSIPPKSVGCDPSSTTTTSRHLSPILRSGSSSRPIVSPSRTSSAACTHARCGGQVATRSTSSARSMPTMTPCPQQSAMQREDALAVEDDGQNLLNLQVLTIHVKHLQNRRVFHMAPEGPAS